MTTLQPSTSPHEPSKMSVLAQTWNDRGSTRLWTNTWYKYEGKFFCHMKARGVDAPPREFADENEFWDRCRKEMAQFPHVLVTK